MRARYLFVLGLGGSVAYAAASQVAPTKLPMDFSKAAAPAPATIELRPLRSATQLVLPVELGSLTHNADEVLPQMLAAVRDWLPDAACGKRTTTFDCNTAKLEGSIVRNGPVTLTASATSVKIGIPVKYVLAASGMGWASHLVEQKSGETTIDLIFAVALSSAGRLDIGRQDVPPAAETAIPLLRANVRLSKLLEPQLKAMAKQAGDDLRRAFAEVPARQALSKTWDAIGQPIELGHGSGLWFKANPESYAAGALVASEGKLSYQIPITTRLAVAEAERGPAVASRREPTLSQGGTPDGPARVRVAVPVDLETMRQQAEAAFNNKTFESRSDRFSEPVKVKVKSTQIYPALNLIGLRLDVDVTTAKGVTFPGKLNLAGRPQFDAASGTVTLTNVAFPSIAGRDNAGHAPGLPRIGIEPFASKLTAAAKLDVAQSMTDVVARANQMLNQPLTEDLRLRLQTTEVVPVSFETTRDGAALIVDVTGDLAITYEGGPDKSSDVVTTSEAVIAAPTEITQIKSVAKAEASEPAHGKRQSSAKTHKASITGEHKRPTRSAGQSPARS